MADRPDVPPEEDAQFHSYRTHRIPWYVRAMWVCFWIGLIWYTIVYVIPAAKDYL